MKNLLPLVLTCLILGGCDNKRKETVLDIPMNNITKENLLNYFDTTSRVWFCDYEKDSTVMVLTDSITRVKIKIQIK